MICVHRMSSKDDEIAELEEKLRILKQDVEKEERQPAISVQEDGLTGMVSDVEVTDYPEMLSEKWKEDLDTMKDSKEGANGLILNTIVSLSVLVGLILFSQVPIGNEGLDKYSTAAPTQSIDLG